MPRVVVSQNVQDRVLDQFKRRLAKTIQQKGDRTFASIHEIRGAVGEEYDELKEAVGKNDQEAVVNESYDLMVAAFWAICSKEAGGLDW